MSINIDNALKINGWMTTTELSYLAGLASRSLFIAEVGSYKGRSARAMADNLHPSGVIFCIDTWNEGETEFDNNLSDSSGIIKVKMDSRRAAATFAKAGITFSLIFIDATHDYENVKADILAWRPLLHAGGVLCGHDFYNPSWPDVKKAVRELIPKFRVVDAIWTTEEESGNLNGDRNESMLAV